ncbi:MAG: MATE family efflux transporter [Sphaerochaetaceae bacterium]|nr:MATE family efflux transporter [Sphaerochaetaceae bacterium]
MKQSQTTLMTEGKISTKIIRFALPVFLGNLFQQLYNLIDALVVGNFVSTQALAAITSTGSLVFLLVGFFSGTFTGAGVVISKFFGARDDESVSKAVHTSIAFALISGLVLTVVGTILSPQILRLMQTPDDVYDLALSYVRIQFLGIMGVVLYNSANGIFQAVGDSKHPLYFLMISSLANVVLDIAFVTIFDWGVPGVAVATIIAQFLSVGLAFAKLSKAEGPHRVQLKKIAIDRKMLRQIIRIGLPSGIQNSVIAFANVIVQSSINAFGSAAAAGYGASAKLEGFVFIPITSLAMSMSTFVGQNLGARNYERARKGASFGIISCILISEAIGVATYIFAPQLIKLFTDDPSSVLAGAAKNRITAFFYFALALSHTMAGILRGAGKSKIPMFVMLGSWCIFRVFYIQVIAKLFDDIIFVFWAYPITWMLSTVAFIIYYLKSDWVHGLDASSET